MLDVVGEVGISLPSLETASAQRGTQEELDFETLLSEVRKEREGEPPDRTEPEKPASDEGKRPVTESSGEGPEEEIDDSGEDGEESDRPDGTGCPEPVACPQGALAGESALSSQEEGSEEPVVRLVPDSGSATWEKVAEKIQGEETSDSGRLLETEIPDEPFLPPDALLEGDRGVQQSFDLLDFREVIGPDPIVDEAPGSLLERLQQAAGPGAAPVLRQAAETVLPQVIRGLVSLVQEGSAEMRMKLRPPDLGEIELRVRTTESAVRSQLMVQHPEVKQLLDAHVDRLRAALAGQGLELEEFDVGVGSDAQSGQTGEPWQRQERRSAGAPSAGAGSVPVEAAGPVGMRRGDRGIDYTA